jgi:NAD(P)-dependent dehydrogenase (short-subunit alcohol dehydrogenase family)
LAREGAAVAFNYATSSEEAEKTVARIREHGVSAWSFKGSVLDADHLKEMVATIVGETGRLDILVNNAGIGQVTPLALMEEEDWDRMLEVHAKGTFLASRAALRTMVKQHYGRILNVGSLAGVKALEAPVHYSAAKAAIKGFTESLAKEIGRYGVTVNCIAPGVLDDGVSDNISKKKLADYVAHCALGRVGGVTEVAEVAAFLVSERNSYMSGATIVIDGAV